MNTIPNTRVILSPKYRTLFHIAFWMIYAIYSGIIYHFGYGFGDGYNYIFVFIIDILTIYSCTKILIPKFLSEKQDTTRFALYLMAAVGLNFLLNFILQNYIFGSIEANFVDFVEKQLYSLQFSFVFIGIAIGLKMFKINLLHQQQFSEKEKSTFNSELSSLKNQINPHFLFNVLNNVYIQTRIDPKKSGEMILKLSDLLRYQLYECSDGKVMLKAEVEYLNNYVELQKMRISTIDLKFEQSGSFKGLMIYPFLFLPFLENSFKYGISSKIVENFIYINIDIVEKYVIFAVKNSKNDTIVNNLKSGGFGLVNIKQRLQLLYPGKHELKIEDRESYFNVELKINLE